MTDHLSREPVPLVRHRHLGPHRQPHPTTTHTKTITRTANSLITPSGQLRPLILDQNVVKALNALVPDLAWDPGGRWTSSQYAVYLDHAHSWAEGWRAAPDVVERALFEFGKSRASPP
ncbi:hypothetical protein [Streptomyces platensis]|uniref:8-oxoguanine DNA glycosylase OGG fold protein n=1 Tax=Streptomyces platensis TaxID=58346 RepID=UPI0039B74CEA